jgi:hypothetical protein
VLAAGGVVALFLASRSPREQHVRLVLGPAAERVTGLELQYLAADGEVARATRLAFEPGRAPRVVSHEPQLVDGEYRLRIDVDTREGRRTAERRVTLGGGTTQVDLAAVVAAPSASESP